MKPAGVIINDCSKKRGGAVCCQEHNVMEQNIQSPRSIRKQHSAECQNNINETD